MGHTHTMVNKYGNFKVFPIALDTFAVYVEYKDCHLYVDYDIYDRGDYPRVDNPDGKLVRITRGYNSMGKALGLCQKYERKMGRFNKELPCMELISM